MGWAFDLGYPLGFRTARVWAFSALDSNIQFILFLSNWEWKQMKLQTLTDHMQELAGIKDHPGGID